MRWQMALYKMMAGKAEDADAPEKVVKRVQEVAAVLYHIEVVSNGSFSHTLYAKDDLAEQNIWSSVWLSIRRSIRSNPKRWFGTNCCPNRDGVPWWPASG